MRARVRALFTPEFLRIWWVSFSATGAGFLLFPSAPFRLRDLGAPPEAAGWFLGFLTYGSALAAAWTGVLGDVLGRRRVLVTAGAVLASFAALYALIDDWRLLVALAVPHGVVWSGLLTSANSEALHAIPAERRAEGIAWFTIAGTIAVAVAPAVGLWLQERSWRALCAAIVVLDLGVAGLALRLPPDPPVPDDFARKLAPHRAIDWRTLSVAAAMLLASFGYGGLTSFVALMAESRGIAPKGIFFTAFALTLLVSRPVLAPLIDRRGPRRAIPAAILIVALGLALTALPRTRLEMIGVGIVYGLGFSVLGPAFTAWVMDNVDAARRGASYGALLAAFDLGIGTGSLALGAIVATYGFRAAFLLAAGLALASWPYLLWAERRAGFRAERPEIRIAPGEAADG
jgi:MFS family permease